MDANAHSRRKGSLCIALAIVLAGLSTWAGHPEYNPPWWANAPLLVVTAFFFGYQGARYRKRASLGRFTLSELDNDDRASILLLRSFSNDNAVVASGPVCVWLLVPSTWRKLLNPHAVWLSYRALFSMHVTFEQVLAFSTRKLGPLVAIGQPGAPPVLGAYNVFVGDDWKEVVADLASTAQLVVLVAGSTPGLLWEVKLMLAQLPPERCLIFIPRGARRWRWSPLFRSGTRSTVWEGFRRSAGSLFPVPLPARIQEAACLAFAPDWSPMLLISPPWSDPTEVRNYVAYMLTAIT